MEVAHTMKCSEIDQNVTKHIERSPNISEGHRTYLLFYFSHETAMNHLREMCISVWSERFRSQVSSTLSKELMCPKEQPVPIQFGVNGVTGFVRV